MTQIQSVQGGTTLASLLATQLSSKSTGSQSSTASSTAPTSSDTITLSLAALQALLGQDIDVEGWPKCGEIDVLENFGYNSGVSSSVYTPSVGETTYGFGSKIMDDGNFHTYRADVGGEGVVFSRDGFEYGHCPASYCPQGAWVFGPQQPNNGGLFVLLNIAVGGKASQNPPPATTKFPATMLVDYVRAWQ